ncbi:MAG: glycosyl hydrolase 2 galactose-binding domain-containing protein [Christensenellales bacterium]|jgi:hypothetical protein
MARKISLSNEIWSMSGYRSYGDFRRRRAEFSGVDIELPSSVDGALERAGIIPDYRLDERGCEWAANRLWVITAVFDMPPEPQDVLSEKHFLWIEDIFGEGAVFLNGREILLFSLKTKDIEADVTGDIIEEGENRLEIAFFGCSCESIKSAQAAYEGLDAPFTAPRGIRGDVYFKSTSYCRIEKIAARRAGGRALVTAFVDAANRGKYMFKYRIVREGRLLGTANIMENLLAREQELCHEIDLEHDGDCSVRLTVERGGIRCDFDTVSLETTCISPKKASKETRAVVWSPVSPRLCDVGADEYERALSLLKNMGINAVYIRRGLRESILFERICSKLGMALIREGEDGGFLDDAALIQIPVEKSLPMALQNARREGRPILISGMISPMAHESSAALLTWELEPTAAYGYASQNLRPWVVHIERGEGEEALGSQIRLISCCDDFSGQVVLAEIIFWDYTGALIATRAASFIQDRGCVQCGDIFPPRKDEIREGLTAVDVKLYTSEGLVASCREIYAQAAQAVESPMPRIQRQGSALSVVNDSPHYSREVMVIDGRLKAHVLALRPWEKIVVTA